jgi:hypothetical protein
MTQPGKVSGAIAALAVIGSLATARAALGDAPPRTRAEAVARRAASGGAQRFGIDYAPSAWRAACRRGAGGGWRCDVGTGGQCSGAVVLSGGSRPRVRRIDVWCLG